MIKLLTADTPHGHRASLILEEAGLDYKVKVVDLAKGEQREPGFLKLNPRGQIPVVVDDEGPNGQRLVLTQSSAIVLFYARRENVLWPEDPMVQTMALQWLMHATSDVSALGATLYALEGFVPDKSEANVEFFMDRLEHHLTYLEQRLESVDYLAGEVSVADIGLFPLIAWRRDWLETLGGFPAVEAWMARMDARPASAAGLKAHERALA
ncbi:MAG: glutathione S-transferase family protein [Pseudomonadota bacterium]